MNVAIENRASVVLFKYLKSNCQNSTFAIPANVCPIVPLVFISAGINYKFVDIDSLTHAIDKNIVKSLLINQEIDSVFYVHAYGFLEDNEDYYQELRLLNCKFIVEDKCLCFPSLPNEIADSKADLHLFSTGYAKYVEFGQGGYGFYKGEYIDSIAYNGKYSQYDDDKLFEQIKQSLTANLQFNYKPCNWLDFSKYYQDHYFEKICIERELVRKHKMLINTVYEEAITQEIKMGDSYNNWRYMILSEKRNEIIDKLFNAGCFAGKNYPSVAYLFDGIHCENAEEEALKTLNLFNDYRITEDKAKVIANIIRTI